jgi:hypothetical protein
MMWLIKILKKRPSDKTIKITRVILGLTLITAWYYNLIYQGDAIENNIFWQALSENAMLYIKYTIIALGFIPLIMWLTNICLLKSKYMRILQIISAFVLFYISSIIVESPNLEIDTLIWVMWILPLIWWITWKFTTTKCLRHWQKITKIRI